ncbi:MAG TPA: bifunctional 3'-5' exonuclease/DNA polymerase [Streptosporangiaceae bacterium]|nr:bifunctional 3'-5' exonuclease/DNA polymerase [Streptosporangiaceae bacterium]
MRVAVAAGPGRTALLTELAEDGSGHAAVVVANDLPAAVADYERAGHERGGDERSGHGRSDGVRWVWADTSGIYPSLLRAGVRVDRCHDVALTEALLLAREGRPGGPAAQVARQEATAQATLFGPAEPGFAEARAMLDALIAAHADQQRRISADANPARFGLLAAAESAGGLAAAEMRARGMPWRADVHDAMLAGLLGPRPPAGLRPARLAALASQISAAFGGRPVNPDSPAQLLKAFATDGVRAESTRSGVLRGIDHPAVPLLLEYKELARLHAAHGWAWLDEWVSAGRFHPEYVVGGVVSGRWATRGGGALQIPRVLRRAVVADPGWVLVVADAAQLEPRVLAALAGDHAFAEAAGTGDLYQALAGAFGGDRAKAKVALLSAMYGGAGGEASQLLAVLRRRFPRADQYVEAAARAGEEGRVVRSRLGRACPPPSAEWRGLTASPDDPGAADQRARRSLRARGRFTRNFVVQASAADWALVLLAGLRRRLAALSISNASARWAPPQGTPPAPPRPLDGPGPLRPLDGPGLVFFQHDEVIVHCPQAAAPAVVAAIGEAAAEAGRLVFGDTPVRFPVTTAVVGCYADAK